MGMLGAVLRSCGDAMTQLIFRDLVDHSGRLGRLRSVAGNILVPLIRNAPKDTALTRRTFGPDFHTKQQNCMMPSRRTFSEELSNRVAFRRMQLPTPAAHKGVRSP
jgi:hypothetical protein